MFWRQASGLLGKEEKEMKSIHNYGWIFLLIAMAGDLTVSFLLSFFYKGYSNLKMSISALGNPNSPGSNYENRTCCFICK